VTRRKRDANANARMLPLCASISANFSPPLSMMPSRSKETKMQDKNEMKLANFRF
jgi:hypothetical protein